MTQFSGYESLARQFNEKTNWVTPVVQHFRVPTHQPTWTSYITGFCSNQFKRRSEPVLITLILVAPKLYWVILKKIMDTFLIHIGHLY